MTRKPRPRDASIMTTGLLTTAGLVGLFMAVTTLGLISYGTHHFGNVDIGTSMGVTAFSLMLITAAFEARSVKATAIATETFDNRHLNWTALGEFVLAVLITQMDVLRRLFGTVELTMRQWSLALVPAVLLFFLWELGKVVARREADPLGYLRKSSEAEFMQKRSPVGWGPSGKRWPRWAPHVAQRTSVRTMPCEVSVMSSTLSGSTASQKLGQPVPESNLVSERKSSSPHTTQW